MLQLTCPVLRRLTCHPRLQPCRSLAQDRSPLESESICKAQNLTEFTLQYNFTFQSPQVSWDLDRNPLEASEAHTEQSMEAITRCATPTLC